MAANQSTEPNLKTFFVYAPDGTEEGHLDKRYSVRPQHLARIATLTASKTIRFGGVLLDDKDEPTEEDPRLRIVGSTIIIQAESIEHVRKLIEEDIYYTTGVWDREKIAISPFIPASPLP